MLQTPHPAVGLIFIIGLVINTLAPLLAWVLLGSQRDDKARLWYLGASLYAANTLFFILQYVMPAWVAFGVGNSLSVLMLFLMSESLRRELSNKAAQWVPMFVFTGVFFGVYAHLIQLGLRNTTAALVLGLTLSLQLIGLIVLCFRVGKIYRSRSCAVLALSFFLALVMNTIRSISILMGHDHIPLLEFSNLSNMFVVGILLTTITYSFGYWGFVLEKTQTEKVEQAIKARQADEKRVASEAFAQELQDIIEQRDQMVLMASRFSATHSLAIFNTAIVHELSQPLQAITLSLETLIMKSRDQTSAEFQSHIQTTLDLSQKMGLTLSTLRQLVSSKKADLEVVSIEQLLLNTIPILQAESQRHGVRLTLTNPHHDTHVMANKILLERILINLIANALDAIKADTASENPPAIVIQTHIQVHGAQPLWTLSVSDNGPGISSDILSRISQPFQSTKESGLGVGLALANLMLRMWQGTLSVHNKSQQEGRGAVVSIQIPLHALTATHG